MKLQLLKLSIVTCFSCLLIHSSTAMAMSVNATAMSNQQQKKQITLKGKVTEASTGSPLPGVTIRIKGKSKGTFTNKSGAFTLKCDLGDQLIISFIGFKTKTIKVTSDKSLNIKLEDNSTMLNQVVVETGYQKIDRRLFTGSASAISAKDAKVDGATDVSRMLQGKAAGVQVQNVSGTFGAAPKIRVRGASSINGNQNPLWVVDGVVLEDVVPISADDLSSGNAATLISSAVAGINPDDIESFQILKDASATALYGARAMNGVVVITTKRGRKGITRVNYTGEFTYRLRPSYRDYNIMNSESQMGVYREMYDKGFLNFASTSRAKDAGEFFVMADLINHWDPKTQTFGMPNTFEAKEQFMSAAAQRNTDWFAELFQNSIQQTHAISISGGTDKVDFYGSLSFLNDPGWTIADKVKRFTANVSLKYKFNKQLSFNFLTNSSVRLQTVPGSEAREFDEVSGRYSRDFEINPFNYALNTSRTMRARNADGTPFYYQRNYAPFSILNELRENKIDLNMMDTKFQLELHYTPIKALELTSIGAVRYVKSTSEARITEKSNRAMAYRAAGDATIIEGNRYLYTDPDHVNSYPEVVLPAGGFFDTSDNFLKSYYFRTTANYNKTFDESHIVNILVGNEIKYADRTNRWNDGYGLQYYKGSVPYTDYKIMKKLLENGGNYFGLYNSYDRFVAFFGTASYSYKGMYTFNLTGRYDGSNRLGRARSARWLPTWNASASWNAHETLMKYNRTVSNLLFRGTYGLTASMGPARNSRVIYRNGKTYRGRTENDESIIYIGSLENSQLTWEKQYETNLGMDLGLFNNRISFSGDIYWRRGFDLIGWVTTSGIGGEEFKFANFADMKSHGLEFTLNTQNIRAKDFSWSTNFTFSYNRNEITKLDSKPKLGRLTRPGGAARKGYPVRGLFSIPFEGLNDKGIPTFRDANGKITSTNIDFQQNSNLGFLEYSGPIDPIITGGMEHSFRWRGINLGLYFTYQEGNVIRLSEDFWYAYSDQSAMPLEMRNRWMIKGDEKKTNIPAIMSAYNNRVNRDLRTAYKAYNQSNIRVAKGDYIRLKDVSLSYALPKSFVHNYLKIESASVKFVASNVWLIYSDKKLNGVDPEFSRSGGVALPTPHQFTLSLRLGF